MELWIDVAVAWKSKLIGYFIDLLSDFVRTDIPGLEFVTTRDISKFPRH